MKWRWWKKKWNPLPILRIRNCRAWGLRSAVLRFSTKLLPTWESFSFLFFECLPSQDSLLNHIELLSMLFPYKIFTKVPHVKRKPRINDNICYQLLIFNRNWRSYKILMIHFSKIQKQKIKSLYSWNKMWRRQMRPSKLRKKLLKESMLRCRKRWTIYLYFRVRKEEETSFIYLSKSKKSEI